MTAPISPVRAPVKPRTYIAELKGNVSIEDEIMTLVQQDRTGLVAITGPSGCGKTTALQHLAHALQSMPGVCFESLRCHENLVLRAQSELVVYATSKPYRAAHTAVYPLAPWSTDEFIEYLLATHRDQCASVMKRVALLDDAGALHGLPALWRVVLDEMAADEKLLDANSALLRYLSRKMSTQNFEGVQFQCLANTLVEHRATVVIKNTKRSELVESLRPSLVNASANLELVDEVLLRNKQVQLTLASHALLEILKKDDPRPFLAYQLPYEMVKRVADMKDAQAVHHLLNIAASGHPALLAMAASILHASGLYWKPTQIVGCNLSGAYLSGAEWPQLQFLEADLQQTELSNANLTDSNLIKSILIRASLNGANLVRATLDNAKAIGTSLIGADLSFVRARHATFVNAILTGAKFAHASLADCNFSEADLRDASFEHANLARVSLVRAKIEGANFSRADLKQANMLQMDLRQANFKGVSFEGANLTRCNLEGMELPGSSFEGASLTQAYLTGSAMPLAKFRNADLRGTGLAEISWEGADLRDANLTGATFHMGNTRSGLVNSYIAMEGSKTGFYTDEYHEQGFKAPEQIRKANLRGADLRGAVIEGVDFYLVDLRDAKYDEAQREHLRRCGAILEHRVV